MPFDNTPIKLNKNETNSGNSEPIAAAWRFFQIPVTELLQNAAFGVVTASYDISMS